MMEKQAVGFPKEHDSGIEKLTLIQSSQSRQQFFDIARSGIFQTLPPYRLFYGADNFLILKVINRYSFCRLILPALTGMHALQQCMLVMLLRHWLCRWPLAKIGTTIVSVGTTTAGNAKHDNLHLILKVNKFRLKQNRRLNTLQFMHDIFCR